VAADTEGNPVVGDDESTLDAPGALARAKETGERAATMGQASVGGAGRGTLIFGIYLAIVVILLGTVFRHSVGAFVACLASIPLVVSALIYSSRLRNPVLTLGVKRLLTRAGTLTGILGVVTAVLLDVASGGSPLLWIPWGIVVGAPLAVAGLLIIRRGGSEAHG
jgi:hypothetical protein